MFFFLVSIKRLQDQLWSEQIKVLAVQTQTQFIDLRMLDSIEKMIDAINKVPFERFILCGFSMGGYIAQEYTILHPSRVFHLILVSVSGEGLSASEIQLSLQVKALIEKGYSQKISENVTAQPPSNIIQKIY